MSSSSAPETSLRMMLRRTCWNAVAHPAKMKALGDYYHFNELKGSAHLVCDFCLNGHFVGDSAKQRDNKSLGFGIPKCAAKYAKREGYALIKEESFYVRVTDGKDNPFPLVPGDTFLLPTQQPYAIQVFNPNLDATHFTVESMVVGSKEVKLFTNGTNGIVRIGQREITVKGFTPGEPDSFKFVSFSGQEKKDLGEETLSAMAYNDANIITLTLQGYKEKEHEVNTLTLGGYGGESPFGYPSTTTGRPGGGFGGFGIGFGAPGASQSSFSPFGSSRSYGAPPRVEEPTYTLSSGQSFGAFTGTPKPASSAPSSGTASLSLSFDPNLDLLSVGPPRAAAIPSTPGPATMADVPMYGAPSSATFGARVTGGTTVSGGQMVEGITARASNSKWSKVGEQVIITFQLGCFQTDADKERDNKRFAMHDLGYDFYVARSHALEEEVARLHREATLKCEELYTVRNYVKSTFDVSAGDYPPVQELINPEERVAVVAKKEARKNLLPVE